DAAAALESVAGVTAVQRQGDAAFEIECHSETDCRPALAELAVTRGWGLLELRPSGMSLEDIFLELTGAESEAGVADDEAGEEESDA
ncbi:MAG TPA: hypothetical protein DEP84_31645, partial [Chloroflexi bacterium]|nr:hypothetical protein [Chloroflexota bacterium]